MLINFAFYFFVCANFSNRGMKQSMSIRAGSIGARAAAAFQLLCLSGLTEPILPFCA